VANIPPGLQRRQANLLSLLAVTPSLSRADYQQLCGISHNTAARDLAELLAARLLARIGAGPSSRYYLPLAENADPIDPAPAQDRARNRTQTSPNQPATSLRRE
jgi:predicted DNA-binding transcriptional regulator YafY